MFELALDYRNSRWLKSSDVDSRSDLSCCGRRFLTELFAHQHKGDDSCGYLYVLRVMKC